MLGTSDALDEGASSMDRQLMACCRRARAGALRWLVHHAWSGWPLAFLATSTPVLADDAGAGVPLEWRAPPACPTRSDVLARVASLAERGGLRWTRFERIRASVEHAGSGWQLVIEFVAPGGSHRRTMQSPRCADLAEGAAVAIVLALRSDSVDGDEWGAPPAADDTRAASGQAPPEMAEPAKTPDPPERERDESAVAPRMSGPVMTLAVEAEAALDPITLGSAAFGAAAGIRLGVDASSAALYAAGFPSAKTPLGVDQSVAIALWAGGLRGCYGWGRGIETCALLELGEMTAQGIGLVQARESRDLWAAPGLTLGFTALPFEGWGITTRLSAYAPVVRGRYRVDDGEVVHRVPAIGLRAALGIDVPIL